MDTFSTLCRGLYQPILDKVCEDLQRDIGQITAKYAARRFPVPPGAMYSEIWERYKAEISVRAKVIIKCCRQAYKSCSPKPDAEEFSNEVVSAITQEQCRITATASHQFAEFNGRYSIPAFDIILEQYKSNLSSEGRRVTNCYASRATAFVEESLLEATRSQELNRSANNWYQRPIGITGITVLASVLSALAIFLIKNHAGLAL